MSGAQEFPAEWYEMAEADHFWFYSRTQIALELVRDLSVEQPLRVLDVGCGAGTFGRQLEQGTAWTVEGVDVNAKGIQKSSGSGRGKVFQYDVFRPNSEMLGAYDVVCLMDVLEHIEQPGPFLDAALAHLKPGGHLLVNVPALQWLYSEFDRVGGHYRRYTVFRLLMEIRKGRSLIEVDCRYWGLFFVPLLFVRKLIMPFLGTDEKAMEVGFKPPSPWVNQVLKWVAKMERMLLPRMPLGSSVIGLWQKPLG